MNRTFTVKVKWGKQIFKDVELEEEESFNSFFATLYSLTMVPIEKQKILFKGKFIKVEIIMITLIFLDQSKSAGF